MTLRRASVLLPSRGLDDFPIHLSGQEAAGLLSASTALWHPAFLAAMGCLPGWRSTEDLPDPDELDGELILVPWVSRQKLPSDWCDRLQASGPRNPPPVEAVASRQQTIAAALTAAALESNPLAAGIVQDFLALGYAHLQVELLTSAMHYSSILAADQFDSAVIEAARAAMAGNEQAAHDGLARAFDLLSDARNHAYSVDIYLIDVTLLADATLGESLRAKLAAGSPTNLLAWGELIEKLSVEHPQTMLELRRAMEAGAACVVGGMMRNTSSAWHVPETLLAEVVRGQNVAQRHLGRGVEIFGQFRAAFSPLLPEVLAGLGFRGALYAAFDGGALSKAEQCKIYWAPPHGPRIEAVSITPLDVAEPKTWLTLAMRMSDTIVHDHVATVLLAGWPGQGSEYFDDLRRVAQRSAVLGKFVTLEEYFSKTRELDEWTTFWPRERGQPMALDASPDSISTFVAENRQQTIENHDRLRDGLTALISTISADTSRESGCPVALNAWNFERAQFIDVDPLDFSDTVNTANAPQPACVLDVPACGFAALDTSPALKMPLARERTLRNELIEVVISETTGGIQSLRAHRDRRTRASQRLVFFDVQRTPAPVILASGEAEPRRLDTQMSAERIEITRNDAVFGEITSRGRLLDAAGELLARFTQVVRLPPGAPTALVEIRLRPERRPVGAIWDQYFASRLAWADETATLRRGAQWFSREANGEHIVSPEWVDISDGVNPITCFGLGLPLHRRAGPTWLDTLLIGTGDEPRFQFAVGLDCKYPTQTALSLLTAGRPSITKLHNRPSASRGWFLHVGAKNVLLTHLEPLEGERQGVRLRLLEIEGRDVRTNVVAFRAFHAARTTDFRGESTGVLSVVDGEIRLDIGGHRWLQIEAEW